MMKIFYRLSALFLLTALLFSGCEKNTENVFSEYDLVDPEASALIKVNYNVAFFKDPGVQLKINGTRVTGLLNTRYPFPGGGFNTLGGSTGDYFAVAPGAVDLSLSIPKKGTNIDSVSIFQTNLNLTAGKRYSLHLADTIATKSLLVDENFVRADSGFVRMRFVNLIPNLTSIDLYNNTTKVASAIPFMGISDSFQLPITSSTVWNIRVGGSAANSTVIATYTSASTMVNTRVYTAFATGWSARTETSRKPYIAFYYVR
jgi:hypothetical protein